jgi:rod shape-determining protein MreD
MTIDTLKRLLFFLLLCLAQVLVLNRIQLFNMATPLLYVNFVLTFPLGYPKWGILLWSFAMGVIIDTFSNTPGLACASLTLLGCIQPYLIQLFIPQDADETMEISIKTLGMGKFFTYSLMSVFVFCLVFYSLEAFNFFNWQHWLGCIVGSTIVTMMLVMAFQSWKE